jgi:hypothetical protein
MQHVFQRPRSLLGLLGSVVLAFILVAPLAARADEAGPPGAVARISIITGSVAVVRGDSSTPIDAAVNAPILGGDYITTGADSRAEIQFDGSSMVRLGDNVQMRFSTLDNDNRELQLAEGTIDVRLLRSASGNTTVDTPSITVHPQQTGSYRVSVTPDGETRVTVRSGRVDIVTPQGTQSVATGSTLVASGTAANPIVQSTDEIALDQFDRFNHDRDLQYQTAVAQAPNVNTSIQGVGDLTQYGSWVPDPTYGQVWVPNNVAPDWAPYRDGRWVWEDGYGWTWLSAEPWGWAPYHYGNWFHSAAYGWAWFPPRPGLVAPPWRPALVAFISFGSVGIGVGNIGWVPLAPYEVYHPWFGPQYYGGRTIINNITVTNVNVTHAFRNAQFNGVSSVTQDEFHNGSFRHTLAVSPATLRGAHLVNGPVPIVPGQANLRFTEHATTSQFAARPLAITGRTFAGNAHATTRVPFEQQRTALATGAQLPTPVHASAAVHAPTSSWERFNSARVPAADVRLAHPAAAPNAAWSRFNNGQGPRASAPANQRPSYVRPSGQERPAQRSQTQPRGQQRQPRAENAPRASHTRAPAAPSRPRPQHSPR